MRFTAIVLTSSAALLAMFGGAGYWLTGQDERELTRTLELEAKRLVTAYEVSEANLGHLMIVLATSLANDAAIAQQMALAVQTLQHAGGATSDADARALLTPHHQALHALVRDRWQQMSDDIGVRQMQFVLPDARTLLRLQAPEIFGDSLHGARPMLEDVLRLQQPLKGFELARTFSGIRGAVPVWAHAADGSASLLGVVEIGVLFDRQIERLSLQTGVGYAVLLRPAFVSHTLWKDNRVTEPDLSASEQICCHLVAASRDELRRWLAEDRLGSIIGKPGVHRVVDNGRVFQLVFSPLRDYLGGLDSTRESIGSVAIWQDVTALVSTREQRSEQRMLLLIGAWLLTQGMTLALLWRSRDEWQRQLDKQTETVRKLSQEQAQLLATVAEGIYGVDAEGRTRFVNPAACTMLGFSEAALLGKDQHALFHHHHEDGRPYPEDECPINRTLADGKRRASEEWFFRSDGSGFPAHITVTASYSGSRLSGAVVAFHDISEQRKHAQSLMELASTDWLTGLANRRRFMDELARELARFRREHNDCAVMMCDLDHFKQINDTHGHAVGDRVLQSFATIAGAALRSADLVGRVGGEEFAVLLPDCDASEATAAAERLRQAVASTRIETRHGEIGVTISIGVSMFSTTDKRAEEPLDRADTALYRAKADGRNRIAIEPPGLAAVSRAAKPPRSTTE